MKAKKSKAQKFGDEVMAVKTPKNHGRHLVAVRIVTGPCVVAEIFAFPTKKLAMSFLKDIRVAEGAMQIETAYGKAPK